MNTRLFLVCLKKQKQQTVKNNIGILNVFVRMFEIVNALTNSSRRICLRNKNFTSLNLLNRNLLSYPATTYTCIYFKTLFTKNSSSQVSVEVFKVSVVRLIRSLVT